MRPTRRALLAAPLSGAAPAAAQIRRTALGPLALPVRQDDTVAPQHARALLVRWGDRVTADAPPWAPDRPEAEAAAAQFGWDARVVGFAAAGPAADSAPRGVLAVTHPTVLAAMAFPDGRDRGEAAAAMLGASLLNLEVVGGRWTVVDGGFQSRRLTRTTLCRLSGPLAAAGSEAALGLRSPRGGAMTPWGTLLLAEAVTDAAAHGFVVELDPRDPAGVPAKRTALGQAPHGDVAATRAADGRAVVYLCERRTGGALLRFVSQAAAGADALDVGVLDAGTLSVARFEGERLRWADLPNTAETLRDLAGAAASAGATPLDTPAGLATDPRGARLLIACRGSPARPAGHVLEVTADRGDAGANGGRVVLLFAAGDPVTEGRYGRPGLPPGSAWPENPDSVAIDARGRAWIGCAAPGPPAIVRAQADGVFACDLDGPGRGVPLPLYGAPRAAAVGGVAVTEDAAALFAGVAHPGAERGATFARPGTRWPGFTTGEPPRSAVVAITRDGGPVGG